MIFVSLNKKLNKKVLLLILDGWGIADNKDASAPDKANTPNFNSLIENYPNNFLITHGEKVGLPKGQMGNSEVGHMNIGSGRIVLQDLLKINNSIKEGEFRNKSHFNDIINYTKKNSSNVHLMGLVSDGGVHSHIDHLKEIILSLSEIKDKIYIHAFTDGRDVDPKSGYDFISDLEDHLEKTTGKLATVTGRYYAMDRDKRWERVKLAYDAIVHGQGVNSTNILSTIRESYEENITDEFIKPIVINNKQDNPTAKIEEDDVVIFFNFRTDRGRQLTQVLSQEDFHEYNMHKINLHYVTLTNYDDNFKGINIVFGKDNLSETLGEILDRHNKNQIRIAETEKYPHVTFFFSGGREEPFKNETRILRNSPKVATYDLKPEMSAYELRDALVPELEKGDVDFICLNFANGDMVGHTGVMEAAIKACEAVDECVKDVITSALENDYTTILIADHGNCETMVNTDGTPHTAHTTNPVPVILIDKDLKEVKDGILGDIAPTILKLLGIPQPDSMTRHSLV